MSDRLVRAVRLFFGTVLVGWLWVPAVLARELSREERIRAQEALERVYHAHRGSGIPFEEAVPRSVLEDRVERYLRQSVALREYWQTEITGEMLARETARMVRGTRMPERLGELFAALDNDPLLVQECLARPRLVERLTRGFFATDERIHGGSLRESVDPPAALVAVQSDPWDRLDADPRAGDGGLRAPLIAKELRISARTTESVVPTKSWDRWWSERGSGFDGSRARTVADPGLELAKLERRSAQADEVGGESGTLPAFGTWDNGILDDLPSARIAHSAVWTGQEMIVWGGSDTEILGDGGRYDPVTDSWRSMSEFDAPSPRHGHSAVWTGREMVVWGGYQPTEVGGLLFLNDGGRYDPESDTWTPVSTVNAPAGRAGHAPVWTGQEMIVWGGGDDDTSIVYSGGNLRSGRGFMEADIDGGGATPDKLHDCMDRPRDDHLGWERTWDPRHHEPRRSLRPGDG